MTAALIPFPKPEASTFEEAWALVPTSMRRRSCKLEALRKLWADHGRKFGQQELLGSLQAYVSDKDIERTGGQALERWLRSGRYENFAVTPAAPPADQFSDKSVRAAVRLQLGEDFCRCYLDQCGQEGTALIAKTDTAVKRLLEHRALFRALGFTGVRKRK